jgi:hypothetical protein
MRIGRRQVLGGGIAFAMMRRLAGESSALDLALVQGVVWSGVAGAPLTDAIGIAGDRIVALGRRAPVSSS